MAKPKYVTDNYIEQVNHYVNNNLDLSELYVDESVSYYNQSVIDAMKKKGEKYIRLEGDNDYVVLTSFGRIINTKRITQYSVRFTKNSMVVYVFNNKVNCPNIFKEQGWEYDVHKIMRTYKRYKWEFRDTTNYDSRYAH